MKQTRFTILLIFFIFSIFILFPFLTDPYPIKQNDLNGNVFQLVFLKNTLFEYFKMPLWNPYINQGLPFPHDPLNTYLYPLTSLSFIIFNPELAIKITYLISIFLSSVNMYTLIRHFKIHENIALLVSLTYASSGFLISRITAGHLEKILTYPLLPLFILLLFKLHEKPTLLRSGITAIILSLMLFAGDIYTTTYSIFILFVLFVFNLFKNKKISLYICIGAMLFILFSSIKFFPMLELQGLLAKEVDPYAGSINLIGFVYYLFIPLKQLFNILNLDQLITTDFGWWEKIAFIGPLPLITLIAFFYNYKSFKINSKYIIPVSLIALVLLATPAIKLNPYYHLINLIPNLSDFHVPSRTFAFFGAFLLLIMALTMAKFINNKIKNIFILLLVVNLTTTCSFFYGVHQTKQFKLVIDKEEKFINIIKNDENSIIYVAYRNHENPLQYKYIQNNIKLLAPNYGFQIKNSPAKNFTKFDYDNQRYTDINPKYFIAKSKTRIPNNFKSEVIASTNAINLFMIENYTPYASLSGGIIQNISIKPNQIQIESISSKSGLLLLHESNFPGWNAYYNNEIIKINDGRFISVNTEKGYNKFVFIFKPISFYLGLIISLISFISWFSIVIFQNKKYYKKYFHNFLQSF